MNEKGKKNVKNKKKHECKNRMTVYEYMNVVDYANKCPKEMSQIEFAKVLRILCRKYILNTSLCSIHFIFNKIIIISLIEFLIPISLQLNVVDL